MSANSVTVEESIIIAIIHFFGGTLDGESGGARLVEKAGEATLLSTP